MKQIILCLILVLAVGGCEVTNQQQEKKNDTEMQDEEMRNEEDTETDGDNDEMMIEENQVTLDEVIELMAVGGFEGSGVAERGVNDGGFVHRVEARLSDPADDKFYEGWLVKTDPVLEFFSTGKMERIGGSFMLEYKNDEDKSSFNQVVITLETLADGLDGNPEEHVLEGSF